MDSPRQKGMLERREPRTSRGLDWEVEVHSGTICTTIIVGGREKTTRRGWLGMDCTAVNMQTTCIIAWNCDAHLITAFVCLLLFAAQIHTPTHNAGENKCIRLLCACTSAERKFSRQNPQDMRMIRFYCIVVGALQKPTGGKSSIQDDDDVRGCGMKCSICWVLHDVNGWTHLLINWSIKYRAYCDWTLVLAHQWQCRRNNRGDRQIEKALADQT